MNVDYFLVSQLKGGYGKDLILNNINFSLPQACFAGIVGPNGSGKTTLFKAIAGDLNWWSGSILLDGQVLKTMPMAAKAKKIAVVSQFTEIGDFTVEEYVLLGRLPYRERFQFFESKDDRKIAEHYMELTNVLKFRHKNMTQLSGGEQQLAAIARALCQEPQLLLLDEPTSHLDISHQVQVLNLIQRLNTELKISVLMIIHDLNLASEYCDYLLMMLAGTIYKQGTPEEVLSFSTIEKVYNTVVFTQTNPLSKKPAIFLVSERVINEELTKSK